MVSLKPIFLWKYLKFSRNKIPTKIRRLFYLSWEDALWDILDKKQVEKGSVVLVPEFFCGDVEDNIRNHGYKIAYYPVSRTLKTETQQLKNCFNKFKPKVLVILHAVGITNNLFKNIDWLTALDRDVILIEDSVHRIINPQQIKFLKSNHFIIDSLRKVVPLQGSNLYGKKEDLNFSEPPFLQSIFYSLKVTLLWFVMNLFWSLSQIFNKTNISIYFAAIADNYMKSGYDLIGDSDKPARGLFIFNFLAQFLNGEKIKEMKKNQVEFYENNLKNLDQNLFHKIKLKESDKGELIAYPLVIPLQSADEILARIRAKGLLLKFELNDNQWSKKQKIIYLPLGLHLSKNDLKKIVYNIAV